jgi:hypothetical protein
LTDALQHPRFPALASGAALAEPLLVGEIDDLAAFLATLTDAHGSRRPWNPSGLTRCP